MASDDMDLDAVAETLSNIEICQKSLLAETRTRRRSGDPIANQKRQIQVKCCCKGVPFTIYGGAECDQLILVDIVHHPDLIGLMATNDIILAVNGRQISGMTLSSVCTQLDAYFASGETINLDIIDEVFLSTNIKDILTNHKFVDLQAVIYANMEKDAATQDSYSDSSSSSLNDEMVSDTKGPLPPNWEVAYSEQGEKYFINHNSGTTQWEDPRDLPEGWERVEDGTYGTFYVDHLNKRTQYERPQYGSAAPLASTSKALLADSAGGLNNNASGILAESNADGVISNTTFMPNAVAHNRRHSAFYANNSASSAHPSHTSSAMFTRDPSQLRGELITTRIPKGPKGLGFTLIGSDGSSLREEFLQIKSVIPGGPAHRDGVLHMGDVLVYVNNQCVLGATQSQACRIFQSIAVGEMVTLQVCRGYPLVLDPTHRIVTENAYSTRLYDEKEITIKKGEDGFGFTIFESMQGQRVKKILHPERCENLLEGDTLLEMRTTYPRGNATNPVGPYKVFNFRGMPHHELVTILLECPVGFWAKLLVRRNSPRHRSKTPTAGFRYGEQRATPLPALIPRSKTPVAQPPRPVKHYVSASSVPSASNPHIMENGGISNHYNSINRNTIPRQHERRSREEIYENLNMRPSSTSLGFSTPNYVPLTALYNSDDMEVLTVNLIRKPTGFGFRVVGGSEVNTCISVGQVVPGGAAADDGRLRQGDEIIEIDGRSVLNESHETAVRLMQLAGKNGHVKLHVRRKKGKIMEGSPAARCGELQVGDRVIAVNGTDIMSLSHSEIVNLIKDSGLTVRLTIAPPSPTMPPHSAIDTVTSRSGLPSYVPIDGQDHSYSNDFPQFGEAYETSNNPPQFRHLGQNGYHTTDAYALPLEAEPSLVAVELNRGPKGFGFSIRGGQEFEAMPLFVLRIAENGPAALTGKLKVGDQLMEINGHSTKGMTHATAIQIIKQFPTVKLLVRRQQIY